MIKTVTAFFQETNRKNLFFQWQHHMKCGLALISSFYFLQPMSQAALIFEETFNTNTWHDLGEPMNTFTNTIDLGSLSVESIVPQYAITNVLGINIQSNDNQVITSVTNQVTASNLVYTLQTNGNKALLNMPSYNPSAIMYVQKPDTNMSIPLANQPDGLWISWTMLRNDVGKPAVGFYQGNTRMFEVGVTPNNLFYSLASTNGSSFVASNSITAPAGVLHIAAHMKTNVSGTTFDVYLNPHLGNNPGTPLFNLTNGYIFQPSLTLLRFVCSPTAGNYFFDEIRVGTTFTNVAPSTMVSTQILNNVIFVNTTTTLIYSLPGTITLKTPKKLKMAKLAKDKGFTARGTVSGLVGFPKNIKDAVKVFVGVQGAWETNSTNWIYFPGKSSKVNKKGVARWTAKQVGLSFLTNANGSALPVMLLAYSNAVSETNYSLSGQHSIPLK